VLAAFEREVEKEKVGMDKKFFDSVGLKAHPEQYYQQLESRRLNNCVLTPDSVKDFISRGFVNAEPDGVVFNYGHTRGYPGPPIQCNRAGVATDLIMSSAWRKKRRLRPQINPEKLKQAKPLRAVNLVGLSLDHTN